MTQILNEAEDYREYNNFADLSNKENELLQRMYQVTPDMTITSGYRCSEVNKLVGGVSTSQHCKCQAVDFTVSGYTPAQLVTLIKGYGIEIDQLISDNVNV